MILFRNVAQLQLFLFSIAEDQPSKLEIGSLIDVLREPFFIVQ